MLEAREVARHAKVGQYWAELSPLTLSQVTRIDDDHSTFTFRQWLPRGIDDYVLYIAPISPERFRYLWFSARVPRRQFPTSRSLDVGDVWIVRVPNAPKSGLVFIGPDSTESHVHLLSDWSFVVHNEGAYTHVFIEVHLYQEGPAQTELAVARSKLLSVLEAYTNKPRPSSWDHVLKCQP